MLPFSTTVYEAELGSRLGIPVYGPDPSLSFLGTKSGSRRTFAEAGVPYPAGREGVRTVAGCGRRPCGDEGRQSGPAIGNGQAR